MSDRVLSSIDALVILDATASPRIRARPRIDERLIGDPLPPEPRRLAKM
jgi:hypothetical protein